MARMKSGGVTLPEEMTYTQRRQLVAVDYLRGMTQTEIAEKYGVDQSTISRDLKAIRDQWIESALVSFHEAKAIQLAKIDELERTYWDAWRRSLSNRERIKTKREAEAYQELTVQVEGRDGNPQFLAGVQWCIEQRCKIFGLYEPEKFAIVDWRKEAERRGIDVTDEYERLVEQFSAALARGGGGDAG